MSKIVATLSKFYGQIEGDSYTGISLFDKNETMTTKDFFEKQSDLTASKLEIYENYIESYIITLLMQFGVCFIGDLFCGEGKNGPKEGSPLILIEKAKKLLNDPILKDKKPNAKIYILFNDSDSKSIDKLKEELEKISIPKNIIIFPLQNKPFQEILKDIDFLKSANVPKFFFLDPYTYSVAKFEDIAYLKKFPYTEILLFNPIFHVYRFANAKKKIAAKTKQFIETFTTKGMFDYEDVYDFSDAVKEKFRNSLSIDFVNYVILDGGSSKNSIFLLTKHIKGGMLFNKISFKKSPDGQTVTKDRNIAGLFNTKDLTPITKRFIRFKNKLIDRLKEGTKDNIQIIYFTVQEGFLPKHTDAILSELKKASKISVNYYIKTKQRGLYISEKNYNQKLSEITFNT